MSTLPGNMYTVKHYIERRDEKVDSAVEVDVTWGRNNQI